MEEAQQFLPPGLVHLYAQIFLWQSVRDVLIGTGRHLFKLQVAVLKHWHVLVQVEVDGQVGKILPQGRRSQVILQGAPLDIVVVVRISPQSVGVGDHNVILLAGFKLQGKKDGVHGLSLAHIGGFPVQHHVLPVLGVDLGDISQGIALHHNRYLLPIHQDGNIPRLHIGREEHGRGDNLLVRGVLHGIGGHDLRLGPFHGDIQHLRGHCKLLIVLKGDGGSHIWIGRRSHVGMGLGGKQEQEKQGTQGRKLTWNDLHTTISIPVFSPHPRPYGFKFSVSEWHGFSKIIPQKSSVFPGPGALATTDHGRSVRGLPAAPPV